METRDKLILLLAAGGIGYGVYTNWDAIREKLGLDDLHPGRVKALELTKKAYSLDRYRVNWEILDDLRKGGEIQVLGDGWQAELIGEPWYRVTFTFKERGQPRRFVFHANVATATVELKDRQTGAEAAAPLK